MKKLFVKGPAIIILTILIVLIRIIAPNFNDFKTHLFKNLPGNNVSNSPCFKSKLDHLINAANFKNCTLLIGGASTSLYNISGSIVENRTKQCVYNISSWALSLNQLNQLLKIIDKKNVKCLLVAFNEFDFYQRNSFDIDYKSTDLYINGSKPVRDWVFLSTFNLKTCSDDWTFRAHSSDINNIPHSTNFDTTGSVQLRRNGFIKDTVLWNLKYNDSTGYNAFYKQAEELQTTCANNSIKLILVYLPIRDDEKTNQYTEHNHIFAGLLREKLGSDFVNLSGYPLSSSAYCDYGHIFSDEADKISNMLLDSLNLNNNQHI